MTTTNEQMRERIDVNRLEQMAKERPSECFLKGSGVLKLIGAIRQLEREVREAALRESAPAPQELIAACDRALRHFERIRGDKEDTALMICLRRALSNALSRSTAPQEAAPVEWISVEDRLPNENRYLLVTNNVDAVNAFGQPSHVWMSQMLHKQSDGSFNTFAEPSGHTIFGVTHWRYRDAAAPVSQDALKEQNAELVKDAQRWQELLKQHNSIIGESLTVFLDKEDGSLDPVADLKSAIDAAIASAHQENKPAAKGDV